jgi:iron complex outermembrane receptor protein
MNIQPSHKIALRLVLLLGFSVSGFAQSTDTEEELDDVIVMDAFQVTGGFSGSLAAAAEIKQQQPIIAEVITAEDIGKLPEVSIAESLTRLPGITTQRVNSRAQEIVIRGMPGDFSTALLNGREQVSAGDGRSIEFDQYPAELLSSVVVYKATDASLVGQGIAGTVDMRTVRPLSQGRRTVAGNFFYEWNEMGALNAGSKDYGMRYSLSYIDQFADETVGLAIGYAGASIPGQGEQWNAWGFPNAYYDSNEPFVLGGAKPFVRSSELERDGVMIVLENAPSDNLHSTIDVYFSQFDESQTLRGIEVPLQWSSAVLRPDFTAEDGLITRGTFDNVYGVMRNDVVTRDAEVFAAGWNLEVGDKDSWHHTFDASFSKIERKDTVLETYSGYASNQVGTPDTITYHMGQGEGGAVFDSILDYSDANAIMLAGPQGWGGDVVPGGQVGFLKGPESEDELTQLRFHTEKDFEHFFNRLEMGVAYTARDKYEIEAGPNGQEGFFLALANGQTSAPLPPSIGTTDLSFIGLGPMVSYDPQAALDSGIYTLIPNDNPAYVSNNWDVGEDIYLGYVEADMRGRMGDIPFYGNIGAQFVQSEQTSKGLSANGTDTTPVTGSHDYFDFVPSLNLNFELGEGRMLRFSAARQLARQKMVDMRAGETYSFNESLAPSTDPNNSPWSGSGGNPELEPWRSNSVDLSFEQYFADSMGYWAISAFYKDLVSYTYIENTLVSYEGLPTGSTETPAIYEGYRSRPENGAGGHITGVEATLSIAGEKISPMFEGFGFVGSMSFFDSSIQPDLNNPAITLPGLSDQVMNGTLYYERGGFSARVSARYRSEYRGDISTFGPRGENFRFLQSETVIDAQISYAFREGPLEGFTLIGQAYNLTDEPLFATSGTDTRYVQDYHRYGASYSIGFSYRY